MARALRITLLDPSMADHTGAPPLNLGDLIIHEAVMRELSPLFGTDSIERLSTHIPFARKQYRIANQTAYRFIGGTNLLASKAVKKTWYREQHRWNWLFPKLRPVVLLGVGWGSGYPAWSDWRVKVFYHRSLNPHHLHSVRDTFSERMLRGIGIRNVIHTSCPTLWNLNGFQPNPESAPTDCAFTLTDYCRVPARDEAIIAALARFTPGTLHFFPQGSGDISYLKSLEVPSVVRERIHILEADVAAFGSFLDKNRAHLVYIGTRLHGGVFAMQHSVKALVINVDHRAEEIARDTGLPLILEDPAKGIEAWLSGALHFDPIHLPMENIERWRRYWLGKSASLS
jgi:hypothetical protein